MARTTIPKTCTHCSQPFLATSQNFKRQYCSVECKVRGLALRRRRHGHTSKTSKSRTYNSWCDIIARCTKETHAEFHNYGGRGITVDPRWFDFAEFLKDMGERPSNRTIDRMNNDGHYYKENCRWATVTQQNRNRRNLRYVTFAGRTQCLIDWAEERGIPIGTVYDRMRGGQTDMEALRMVEHQHKGRKRFLTYNSRTQTVAEWAAELGIKLGTVYWRLAHGQSDLRALRLTGNS